MHLAAVASRTRGLHLDISVEDARRVFKIALGSEFRASARSQLGEAAELLADLGDPVKSLLFFIYPSGYRVVGNCVRRQVCIAI